MKKYLKYLNPLNWFKKEEKDVTEKDINKHLEKNKEKFETIAVDIKNNISDSWFSLNQFMARAPKLYRKEDITIQKTLNLLNSLKLSNLLVSRMNIDRNGLRVEEYKIVTNSISRMKVLTGEKERLTKALKEVEEQIKNFKE